MKVRRGPDGVHLFDRKTGANILLDEEIPPQSSWSTSPRQVSIALTNACDLVCPHCYAPKQKAALDSKNVKRWISELDEHGCFGVGFGGGEPTLHSDLVDICKFGQSQTNLAITMTTHGHRLNDALLSQLAGNINFIRISMDGVGSTYETIRNRSFDSLLKILRNMRDVIPFGLNYVINSQTIDGLDDAAQIAEDVGACEILLLPEEAVGKGTKIDNVSLENLIKWVGSYRGSTRLAVSSGGADSFPTANALLNEVELSAFAHIDASGNLKNTSFECSGVAIDSTGVMSAFQRLNKEYIEEIG